MSWWKLAAGFALTGALVVATSADSAGASGKSEQIVFSGTGSGTFEGTQTRVGFWVWCENESENPYALNCAGSIHFNALGLAKGVSGDDAVSEPEEGQYLMTVASRDGSVSCSLENTPPITAGPTNTVDVTCSSPSGSGTSNHAVVSNNG